VNIGVSDDKASVASEVFIVICRVVSVELKEPVLQSKFSVLDV